MSSLEWKKNLLIFCIHYLQHDTAKVNHTQLNVPRFWACFLEPFISWFQFLNWILNGYISGFFYHLRQRVFSFIYSTQTNRWVRACFLFSSLSTDSHGLQTTKTWEPNVPKSSCYLCPKLMPKEWPLRNSWQMNDTTSSVFTSLPSYTDRSFWYSDHWYQEALWKVTT